MEKISGVYTITCTVNDRRYVGSSADVRRRWRFHRSMLNNRKHPIALLQADWDEHGDAAFEFRVVAKVRDPQIRLAAEQATLDAYEASTAGYNVASGVIASTGTRLTDEHKLAVSMANKGVPKSAEHRAKLSEAQRASWAARERTPELSEHMATMARSRKGQPMSEEHKRKISEAQKGRPFTPEHLANVRAAKANGGKPLKLTAEKVREIKARLATGASCAALAREYGVKPASISDIKAGRSWAHVT